MKNNIKRCPFCRRSKAKAIREQVLKKEHCGFPKNNCSFFDEIKEALEKKNNIKVIEKEKKKPLEIIKKKENIKIIKK